MVYNEKEVRELLKYSELTEKDKRRRYKMLVELPLFLAGIILSAFDFDFRFIMTMVTGIMVIELIIFGLMDIKFNYSLSEFITDMIFLFVMNFFVVLIATPGFLYTLNQATERTYIFTNIIELIVSFTLLHTAWYIYIILSCKVRKNPSLKWKWDVTGAFHSDGSRFAVK
jgi:hypothetical protein